MDVRCTLRATTAIAILSAASAAQAGDRAAEGLYQDGRRAAVANDWALACQKFAESQQREPAPGTLLNLANCEEKRGQLVAARTHFDEAARLFRSDDTRVEFAKRRESALQGRIPKLVLKLPPNLPAGTVVERDGVAAAPTALADPIDVDPGNHAIVIRAPGHTDMRVAIRMAEGETRELELTVGALIAATVDPGATVPSLPNEGSQVKSEDKPAATGRSGRSTAALVSFGVGGIGLGFGIVGGILAINARNAVESDCPGCGCKDSSGIDAASRGKTWGAVSTVGFIVAGVGAVGGAVLWLTTPRQSSTRIGAAPLAGGGEMLWQTTF